MSSHYWPEREVLIPIPPPPRPPERPLLMGVNIAAGLVFVGLLVNVGRVLLA
jgi:hypothetical protein